MNYKVWLLYKFYVIFVLIPEDIYIRWFKRIEYQWKKYWYYTRYLSFWRNKVWTYYFGLDYKNFYHFKS